MLAQNAAPESQTLDLQLVRQQLEDLSQFSNAKLDGTFTGNIEERIIKTDAAGRFLFCRDYSIFWYQIYLEIPVTIYTPVDVNKDKLVIFYHGGGKVWTSPMIVFSHENRFDIWWSKNASGNGQSIS